MPEKQLAPQAGTMERYRLQEWLTFIGTEIHKQFSPLFNPAMPEEAKALFSQRILDRLDLSAFMARTAARPAVQQALKAEGLPG